MLPEFGSLDVEQAGARIYGSAVKAVWDVAARTDKWLARVEELGIHPGEISSRLASEGVPGADFEKHFGYFKRERGEVKDLISISGPWKGTRIDVMCVPEDKVCYSERDPKGVNKIISSLMDHCRDHPFTFFDMITLPNWMKDEIKIYIKKMKILICTES